MSTTEAPDEVLVCLTSVRVDRLLDFVFVNLDPSAVSIAGFWPGVEEHMLATCPDIRSYTLSTSASVIQPTDVAANWKIQIDNFLECQHCRYGHKSFSDMLDVCNQELSLHENYSYAFIPSAGKADNLAYPLNPDYDVLDLHFWYLFPNSGFGQFSGPGNFSLFQWMGSHSQGLPAGPACVARIRAAVAEDCGPCVQLVCDMALEAGLTPPQVAATLAGDGAALPGGRHRRSAWPDAGRGASWGWR